jgi:hypothetical protein
MKNITRFTCQTQPISYAVNWNVRIVKSNNALRKPVVQDGITFAMNFALELREYVPDFEPPLWCLCNHPYCLERRV